MTDPGPIMTNSSNRLRGLALLVLVFGVGGVAGVAADRAWLRTHATPIVEDRRAGRRPGNDQIDSDRIPIPLEALALSPDEERRLHEIARRWRPQAARTIEGIRANVAELENNMFAEMLCVLPKEKQDRYLAQLQEGGGDRLLIDKRFALVRSNRCEEVRRGEEPRR